MALQRVPEDEAILSMIRAGVNTVPAITLKVYGRLSPYEHQLKKNRIMSHVKSMERYGLVRKAGIIRTGRMKNKTIVWEAVE